MINKNNYILWLLSRTTFVFAESAMFLILTKFIEIKTNSTMMISWMFIFFFLISGITAIPIGKYVNQNNNKNIMRYGEGLRVILLTLLLILKEQHFIIGIIYFIISGLITSVVTSASYQLLGEYVTIEKKAFANSVLQISFAIARSISMLIFAFLIQKHININELIIGCIIIHSLSVFFISFTRKKYIKNINNFNYKITFNIKEHSKIFYTIIAFGCFAFSVKVSDIIHIEYLKEVYNLNAETIGYFGSAFSLGSLLSPFVLTKLFKYKKENIIILSPFIIYFIYLIILIVNFPYILLLISFGVFGFFANLLFVGSSIIAQQVEEKYIPLSYSYYALTANFSPLLGLLFANGLLYYSNYMSIIFSILTFFIITIVYLYKKRKYF